MHHNKNDNKHEKLERPKTTTNLKKIAIGRNMRHKSPIP